MYRSSVNQNSHSEAPVAGVDLAALSAVAAQLRDLSEVVAQMCPESARDPAAAATAGHAPAQGRVVDPTAVDRLADDFGTGGALDIVRSFIDELPTRIAAIRQHLRVGDDQLLERSSMTLRSGCSLVGAVALQEWCATPVGPPPLEETEDGLRSLASRLTEYRNADVEEA